MAELGGQLLRAYDSCRLEIGLVMWVLTPFSNGRISASGKILFLRENKVWRQNPPKRTYRCTELIDERVQNIGHPAHIKRCSIDVASVSSKRGTIRRLD